MYRNRLIYLIADWLCNWRLFINVFVSLLTFIIILECYRDKHLFDEERKTKGSNHYDDHNVIQNNSKLNILNRGMSPRVASGTEDKSSSVRTIMLNSNYGDKIENSYSLSTESDRFSSVFDLNYTPFGSGQKMKPRLPQAIIIGARKCGTRALIRFLELNPKVKAARNEIHFFDRASQYSKGLDWYREQMPDSYEDEITIEKSPAYFVTPSAPQRIKEMNSTIKLIIIVRDPITRLISDYTQILANRATANRSVESDSKSFERFITRSDGGINENLRAVRTGMYAVYLENWRKYFKANQIIIIEGEKLIKSPYDELKKVENFLGLPQKIRQDQFVFNATKGYYCVRIDSSLENFASSEANLGTNRSEQGKIYSEPSWSSMDVRCLSPSKGRKHVKVGAKIVEKLKKLYNPFNEYFYSIIGEKFNWME